MACARVTQHGLTINSVVGRGAPGFCDLLMAEGPVEVIVDPLWLRLEWLGYSRELIDSSLVDLACMDSRLTPSQVEAIKQQAIRQASYRLRKVLDTEMETLQFLAPATKGVEESSH